MLGGGAKVGQPPAMLGGGAKVGQPPDIHLREPRVSPVHEV